MSYIKFLVSLKWYELNGSLQHKKIIAPCELLYYAQQIYKRGVVHFWIRHHEKKQSIKLITAEFIPKQQNCTVQDSKPVLRCSVCGKLELTTHISCALSK